MSLHIEETTDRRTDEHREERSGGQERNWRNEGWREEKKGEGGIRRD